VAKRRLEFRLPKTNKGRRASYFGLAILILFSVISYDLFLKPAPKVKAATIGTSNTSFTNSSNQRQSVVTSTGIIIVFYNSGSVAPGGLVYRTSADNGGTWSSAVQVDSAQTGDFSVAIDGSDNIYIAYENFNIYARKLTFVSGTTWTIGSQNTVITTTNCVDGLTSGDIYTQPQISIISGGTIFIDTEHDYEYGGGGCISDFSVDTYSSTNLSSWTSLSSLPQTNSVANEVEVSGRARWTYLSGSLYVDKDGTGTWSVVPGFTAFSISSISYGFNRIHILYSSGSVILYRDYTLDTGTFSSPVTISSNTGDQPGSIISDSNRVWAFYQSFVGSSSTNVVYKSMSSSGVWDSSATSITTDNLYNTSITSPAKALNSATVPVIWTTGTTTPWTLKSAVVSGSGAVTDTGNQSGSLTGSLTGSNGDVVVKCGVWYYNTVNIVAGMTIKVCASNGATGGFLEIHANSVTIAGTIDGASRGLPGGFPSLAGTGGSGGLGVIGGANTPGNNGTAGSSDSGGAGAGAFGGSGGAGGTNGNGGAGAATSFSGGVAGAGSTTTVGGGGGNGGYLSAAGNGDASTDESLAIASGGGGGGSGGSGGGGGSGASSATFTCANGGSGGNGAAGGTGGKGGDAGANVKIYSAGDIAVSGHIYVNGQAGGTGNAGNTGANGLNGGRAASAC
jgi:hypothetical protein